ncbi:hypothetical protein [Pseudomonas sp. FP1742]|uniref:hypothetical protein n=1 Tax=Pseudomonas sp. FP1742 TaxID=2954079 RepID=UPI002736E88A|nr:hypothetical protein [Pseudomonas sp. FP1742]WLG49138.1 hypothetical protein PSH64_20685 [Pseudomonas sp. FP1742]
MTDYSELKLLAEALHGAEWQLVDGEGFEADNRFVTSQRRIDDSKVAFAEINYGHPEAGMGEPFQSEQVAAGEFIAAANPAAVLALIGERDKLKDENEVARMRIKELDLLFGRYILAMRAAVIEEEHGLGAEGAMMWIYNSLVGPGELPPENETLAQAYFDREIVAVDNGMQEVLAFHDARRAAKEKI